MNIDPLALSCYRHLQSALTTYSGELSQACGAALVGVYICGSVARGCNNPSTSDVDTIAVVRDGFALPDDSAILQVHTKAAASLDVVFVTESQLHADIFPAPIICLVKPDCQIIRKPEGCKDFLLQRQDAYEAGLALIGPSPRDLMHPVPWPLLAESLDYLFPYIVTYFKNPALMLSRITYAWANRKLCGKREAGEWAVATLDKQWSPMLQTALAEYASGIASTTVPKDTLRAFEEHCAELIAKSR